MLFFDGPSNAKYNSLKTDISNQALQGKYAVPRTHDKVLKLASGWKNKSTSAQNNNINSGVEMVHYDGPGHVDKVGRGRGTGQGGRYGKGGGPGYDRGGGGKIAKNQSQ